MGVLKLVNVDIMLPDGGNEFEFEGYHFIQNKAIPHNARNKNKR